MRTLLILRGAMGSGKSTFIKENGLEPFTLEADKFRNLIANPVMTENGFTISQKNNKAAWNLLYNCLEERMKKGDFTVIDATHPTVKDFNNYEKLAELYKYTIYYYQVDATLEECLKRNLERPEYKRVPEKAIKRVHALVENTELPKRYKRIYSLDEIKNFYTKDITNEYENVKVIGDIHSCGTVLENFLQDYNENTLYVFVGDYFDRGIEPQKTWNIIKDLVQKPNVIMLEGNHEKWIRIWANDIEDETISKSALKTFDSLSEGLNDKEIKNLKKELRVFYKKLRQAFAFKFFDKKYLVSHGGVSFVPNMLYVSTNEFIKGYGNYETEIDEIYSENFQKGLCQDFIQIHGHRLTESTEHSICLEGQIEFGGHLKYVEITKDNFERKELKNDIYDKLFLQHEYEDKKSNENNLLQTQNEKVNIMLNSNLIKVKNTKSNTYSLNFTEKVFKKRIWDDFTIKARGLYVDRETGEVVARSYNKFFNFNQDGIEEVYIENLKKNLVFPLKPVVKYNGYLGIISVDKNGEFFIATKSVTQSDYVNWFTKIFESVDKRIKNALKNLLIKYNASATFEVISSNDPHIVKYKKDEIFLLDFIENKLHINGIDIDDGFSQKLRNIIQSLIDSENIISDNFHLSKNEKPINSFEELEKFIIDSDKFENIEGFVFKDQRGFMFKYKVDFYNTWKRRRSLVQMYQKNINDKFDLSKCYITEDIIFMKKVIDLPKEKVIGKSIIEIRDLIQF